MRPRSQDPKGRTERHGRRGPSHAYGGLDELSRSQNGVRPDDQNPKGGAPQGAPEDASPDGLWQEVAALLGKLDRPFQGPERARQDYLEFLARAEADRTGAEAVGVDFSKLDEARRRGESLPSVVTVGPGHRIRRSRPAHD